MKTTTTLTAQERVILFCTATGVSHAAVGITAHAMQSMAIKGFIAHDQDRIDLRRVAPVRARVADEHVVGIVRHVGPVPTNPVVASLLAETYAG